MGVVLLHAYREHVLSTPRLDLRPWEESDLGGFFDLYGRWDVMRWLGPHPRRALADLDEARERLARWQRRHAGVQAPLGLWAMALRHGGGGPVGTALLMPLADATGTTHEVEIGWHLHPDCHGKGLATESARALLGAAADVGLCRVLAVTDPDNAPSQAVARRLGMTDAGLTDRWFGLMLREFVWNPM